MTSCHGNAVTAESTGGGCRSCVTTSSWSSSTPTSRSGRSPRRSTSTSTSSVKTAATVESVDVWGRRRLSYEINKKAEGIYAVVTLSAEPATVKELDRQLGLNESVMRTKVLRPEIH